MRVNEIMTSYMMTYVNHRGTETRRTHRGRFGCAGISPAAWVHPRTPNVCSVRPLCLSVTPWLTFVIKSLYLPPMRFAPEYVTYVLNENFEDAKALFLAPLMAIHYAHLVMLADAGIVGPADARRIREALDAIAERRQSRTSPTTAPTRISSSTSSAC